MPLSPSLDSQPLHLRGLIDETGICFGSDRVRLIEWFICGNAGVEMLYKRIEGAANQVCGKADARDLRGMSFKKACVERAISNAVAEVNSPMLKQVSFEKSDSHVQQSLPIAQVR